MSESPIPLPSESIATGELDFTAALLYPYRAKNRLNTFLLPNLLLIAIGSVTATLLAGQVAPASALFVLLSVLFSGYFWRLSGHFQTAGFLAPAPRWNPWLSVFKAGLKLYPYLILLNLLVTLLIQIPLFAGLGSVEATQNAFVGIILGCILLIYLGPVLILPVARAAIPTPSFARLWQLPSAWKSHQGRYTFSNRAMFQVILIVAIYIVLRVLLVYAGFFHPWAQMAGSALSMVLVLPMLISCWHMSHQGIVLAPAPRSQEPAIQA